MTTNLKSNTINTNTLEPNAVASLVNAYTTQTGKMQIGSATNAGVATNVGICVAPITTGTIRTINIGKTTVDSVHVANVEHIGPAIGNATAPVGGQFDICTAQTTGILNIGTGVRTTTGTINIGTGSTTSAINIGNKTGTANTVVINSGSAGITLASTATVGVGINVKGSTVDVITAGDSLNLGTTNATGGITVGNSTQTNITVGGITIGNNTIRASAVGNNMGFATTTTTGDITLGAAQTVGLLSIGTGTRTAGGNINIGTASTGNVITIGNKTATANGVTISAGTTGITLASGTALAGLKVVGNTVDVVTATEALSIGTSQLTGILNIGTGARTGAGAINIGTGNTSSEINIGNSNANPTNKVFIKSGTPGTSFLTGVSPTNGINIASTIVDTFTTGTLSLGTVAANNVSIGTSGTTTVNNALTATGLITANAGITMGTSQNITLKTATTAPTAQTQLGGQTFAALLSTVPVNGSVYGTITITTPGIYILAFGLYQNITALGNVNYIQLAGANINTTNYGGTNTITAQQLGFAGCEIVNCTASAYTATISINSTPTGAVAGFFSATRIG